MLCSLAPIAILHTFQMTGEVLTPIGRYDLVFEVLQAGCKCSTLLSTQSSSHGILGAVPLAAFFTIAVSPVSIIRSLVSGVIYIS